jgi:hypothetical protein
MQCIANSHASAYLVRATRTHAHDTHVRTRAHMFALYLTCTHRHQTSQGNAKPTSQTAQYQTWLLWWTCCDLQAKVVAAVDSDSKARRH